MFSDFNLSRALWTGCLVASVLACLCVAPATLEAQTTASGSSSSSEDPSSSDGTSGPPPVDEPIEDDVSLTSEPLVSGPLVSEPLDPNAGSVESAAGVFARILRAVIAGACGWLEPVERAVCGPAPSARTASPTRRSRR